MSESAPGTGAEAALAALAARRARMQARRVWSILRIAAVLALMWWSMGPVVSLILTVFTVLCFAWQFRSPAARRVRLAERPGGAADAVECYRQVLDTEIEALQRARSLWPTLFWCFVAVLVLVPFNIAKGIFLGDDSRDLPRLVVTLLCIGLVVWQGWRSTRRDLPRLEREREAFVREHGPSPESAPQ